MPLLHPGRRLELPCFPRQPLGNRASAMLEFALASVPFFFLLFGVLELGLIFVANVCVSNATLQMARQVRVGQISLPGSTVSNSSGTQMDLSDFKTAICAGIPVMTTSSCFSQLQVDVRNQSGFQGQSTPNPVSSGNFNTNGFCFYSGTPGSIVTMHVYLLWPLATPLLLTPLVNVSSITTGGGTSTGSFFVLAASEVFKNEPNSSATNTGNGC